MCRFIGVREENQFGVDMYGRLWEGALWLATGGV